MAQSNHTRLTCYVDDVVLSGLEEEAVEESRLKLIAAAQKSNFFIHPDKSQRCASEVTVFNIRLSNGQMVITDARMHDFEQNLVRASRYEAVGIVSYVHSVNRNQAEELVRLALDLPDEEVCNAVIELAARWEID